MKPSISLIPEPDRTVEERKAIPRAWKDAALARTGHVCAYPDCQVSTGLEFDHIVALKLNGKHRLENIEPLCGPHHLAKTKRDVKMIARAKRIVAREEGTRRPRKAIPKHVQPWAPKGTRKIPTKKSRRAANDNHQEASK